MSFKPLEPRKSDRQSRHPHRQPKTDGAHDGTHSNLSVQECSNVVAVMDLRGREKAATVLPFPATRALSQIFVFPVADGLSGERPKPPVENTKLMIVDRNAHLAVREKAR